MVGVRVVKPQKLGPHFDRPTLRLAIILRPHHEPAARSLIGRVRKRQRVGNDPSVTEQRATALLGIGLAALLPDGRRLPLAQRDHG